MEDDLIYQILKNKAILISDNEKRLLVEKRLDELGFTWLNKNRYNRGWLPSSFSDREIFKTNCIYFPYSMSGQTTTSRSKTSGSWASNDPERHGLSYSNLLTEEAFLFLTSNNIEIEQPKIKFLPGQIVTEVNEPYKRIVFVTEHSLHKTGFFMGLLIKGDPFIESWGKPLHTTYYHKESDFQLVNDLKLSLKVKT